MTKVVSSLLLILNSYLCKLISSETIRILGSDNKASAEAREIQDDDDVARVDAYLGRVVVVTTTTSDDKQEIKQQNEDWSR